MNKKNREAFFLSNIYNHVDNLNSLGYTIIKGRKDLCDPIKDDLKLSLENLCNGLDIDSKCWGKDIHEISNYVATKNRNIISDLYDLSRSFLSTFVIANDPLISKIAKSYMDSKNIILQVQDHIMRIDIPNETQNYLGDNKKNSDINLLLPWHQDYPYNQGSRKSLTVYVPLQSANRDESGTLQVAENSHKNGLAPHTAKKNTTIISGKSIENYSYKVEEDFVKQFNQKTLFLSYGDILIFDMDIIHKSCLNLTGKTRFNLQIRLSDLNDVKYCKRYSRIKTEKHFNLDPKEQILIS